MLSLCSNVEFTLLRDWGGGNDPTSGYDFGYQVKECCETLIYSRKTTTFCRCQFLLRITQDGKTPTGHAHCQS